MTVTELVIELCRKVEREQVSRDMAEWKVEDLEARIKVLENRIKELEGRK